MTAKIAEIDAGTSQVDYLAVVTSRLLRLGQLSPHEWNARDTSAL